MNLPFSLTFERNLAVSRRLAVIFGLPFSIGLLLPLGFAPFHFPGISILSVAFFYLLLQQSSIKSAALNGLFFGLGFFGLGVSWVYVSIHAYGHLPMIAAACITLTFILYLALYFTVLAIGYSYFAKYNSSLIKRAIFFSTLWILLEYIRAHLLTGFPWLLLGISQFDSPLGNLLPILGVYGTGFITAIIATCFAYAISPTQKNRFFCLALGVFILLLPNVFANHGWVKEDPKSISVAAVQANLSMRDKWDESLFWQILDIYTSKVEQLLGTDLIVLPESAIPLPADYLHDTLFEFHEKTNLSHSALIMGIPTTSSHDNQTQYHNAMLGFGLAKGQYLKQHLVPFGEYIPKLFLNLSKKIALVDPDISQGPRNQRLIKVHGYPIAALICYELAYAELLRAQLPKAQLIISLSDDGWFGRSLAIYQQLQIAQVRSKQVGRYQVVSNNDGLTSVLNTKGEIVASLPAFVPDILHANIHAATGFTPWTKIGDNPIIMLLCILLLYTTLARSIK
ncbi:MAG: apolipoprotein N-acyltransferase [Legionellales bacterium RIFCSPHIGHO2_12_FULL_37_14]|nr:MAG: apolipoprotein N-acyltransferase [Legionellales bacterium RIFCSPHIGHO2_12_FULL_37_14]